ncbi:MAG TPA: hypothetical protein VK914_08655 [bacterium]|jgi:flagellar hook-associated protein FlgK|nr:hypothetical protein [bacterium]
MSLNADITTLNSALQAFTYGQSIVAENIANVATPGYSAETLNLASLNDFAGVSVAGVGSTRNSFLFNQIYGQLAQQAFTSVQLNPLTQLADILPATNGLSASIQALAAAWTALAANPTSVVDQTNVLNAMQNMASLFNTDSNQLFNLQQNLDTQTLQAISQVNSLEDQILSLNKQIVDAGGQQSAQTSTLIDQREVDAQSLVALTGATVNYNTNGAMVVTFNGGTLVDGVQSYHLGALPSATTPGLTDIGYVSVPGSSSMADVTADITSGTIGGLYAAQLTVHQSLLTVNQMASGVIQYTNEVNESSAAPDGSYNALLYGTEASDISVNPALENNPNYILSGNDPLNPGNLAAVQGAMTTVNMYSEIETFNPTPGTGGMELNQGTPIDPTATMLSQSAFFANPAPTANGEMKIVAGNNTADVIWTSNMTLNDIVAQINSKGGGAIFATLQTVPNGATAGGQPLNVGQFIHIYSNAPTSVYDVSGNLASVLQLGSVLVSSAPLNAVPTDGINQVNPNFALNYVAPNPNVVDNPMSLYTQPVTPPGGGTVTVNNDPATVFTWNATDSVNDLLNLIQGAAPANSTLFAGFNQPPLAPAQEVAIFSVLNGPSSIGNQLQSVSINDLTGNLTQVLNLDTDTNATQLFSQMTTNLANTTAALKAENTQANSLVSATQALQTAQSGVDENAQLAEAAIYENAYDAAVRMQYVLENMLNFLITQVGTSNNNSGPIGS